MNETQTPQQRADAMRRYQSLARLATLSGQHSEAETQPPPLLKEDPAPPTNGTPDPLLVVLNRIAAALEEGNRVAAIAARINAYTRGRKK